MALSDSDREQFYLELSKLIGAGFPASRASETLTDQDLPKDQARLARRLKKRLGERQDLATALEGALGSEVVELDISLVQAGHQGGRLPESLAQLSEHYGRRSRTSRTVKTQLIYPAILLHLGVLLPALPKIVTEPGMSALWKALLVLVGLYLFLGMAYLLLRWMSKAGTRSPAIDAVLRKIPFYGKVRRFGALSRFSDVFGFFLTAGQKVSTALRSAGKASASALTQKAAEEGAHAIEAGSNLTDSVTGKTALPKAFVRGIATAEQSGTLDDEMQRWSNHYADETERAAKSFGEWVPRLLYFAIMLIVAFQILRMAKGIYAPLFEMMDSF